MKLETLLAIHFRLVSRSAVDALTEAIAHAHRITPTRRDLVPNARALDQVLRNSPSSPAVLDSLNLLLFNVSALNEQALSDLQNQLIESTSDGPSMMPRSPKAETAVFRTGLCFWLKEVLQGVFLSEIIRQATPLTVSRSSPLRHLFETLDYLSLKYGVGHSQQNKVVELVEAVARNESGLWNEKAFNITRRVFAGGQATIDLLEELGNNHSWNLIELGRLINANYYNLNPPRPLFRDANISGRRFIQELSDQIVRKVPKLELFSQKMQNYRSFELLMDILIQREANLFLTFTNETLNRLSGEDYSPANLKVIEKIWIILQQSIPNQYPNYHWICSYLNGLLIHKYGKADALQLMKKFIFNRFLINPFYYALFFTPSQLQMEQFVRNANSIRVLFYQKKAQSLAQSHKNPLIISISQSLRNSFIQFLTQAPNREISSNAMDRGVYINDKLLTTLILNLQEWKGQQSQNGHTRKGHQNHQSHHSFSNDSSLSFSLKNDSVSKSHAHHSRKMSRDKDNSLRVMIDDLKSPIDAKSTDHLPPKSTTQRQARQGLIGNLEGDSVLESLVSLRRQYGESRRSVKNRCQAHRERRKLWKARLQSLGTKLMDERRIVQRAYLLVAGNPLMS